MAYTTTTQLGQRLGTTLYARLTDRINGTTADDTVGQAVLNDAEALADSYLSRRYATPIDLSEHADLANVLTARVLDLAEFIAWQGSPFISDPPQRVHMLRAGALAWFEDIAAGRLVLPASAAPESTGVTHHTPRHSSTRRAFRHDELDGL